MKWKYALPMFQKLKWIVRNKYSFLMIANEEKEGWHYLAVKTSALLRWLLGLRKLKFSKIRLKFFKSDLFYKSHNEKILFSNIDEINSVFSLFLPLNYFLQR